MRDLIADAPATPTEHACANCATVLRDTWCHRCGQRDDDHHRSLRHLLYEAVESLTHADGRMWTTCRHLAINPGRLTRDYIQGRRASQVPPFRLFLIGIVILLFAAPIMGNNQTGSAVQIDPGDSAISIGDHGPVSDAVVGWLNSHIASAQRHPERVSAEMERWEHSAAMLTLLIAAPLLALCFAWKRRFWFYDHVIFAMHSLAFQSLLLAAAILGAAWYGPAGMLALLAPVHLFAHMRGTYGTSVVGTLARMLFLFVGSLAGFVVLLAALVLVGLSAAT